jgi:hypothetical protein
MTRRLLERSSAIEPAVSRADALFLLLHAAWPLSVSVRDAILGALTAVCSGSEDPRAHRVLRDALLMLAAEDEARATQLAEALPAGAARRQTLRRIAAREFQHARVFFQDMPNDRDRPGRSL